MYTIKVLEENMGEQLYDYRRIEGLYNQMTSFLSKLEVSRSGDIQLEYILEPGIHSSNTFSSNDTASGPLCWNSILYLPCVKRDLFLTWFVIIQETIRLTLCCFAMVSIKKFVLTLSTFGTKIDEYSGILSVG